jgi:ABC-type phosphate transport system substrate-binding protein
MAAVTYDLATRGRTSLYSYEAFSDEEGARKLAAGECAFRGTDLMPTPQQQETMPLAWLVPTLVGAVAIGVNVPGLEAEGLRIPRHVLAEVFLGKTTLWSELAEWNPRLRTVQQSIALIVRSDDASSTEAFTRALSAFSAEWAASVGTASLPAWPKADLRAADDRGVAIQIRLTPYSMGYLSLREANLFRVSVANVSNAAGAFVLPSASAVRAAMDSFSAEWNRTNASYAGFHAFRSIVDPKGSALAYPIATLTYIAFDPTRLSCRSVQDIAYLLQWAWTDGKAAEIAEAADFTPLSPAASSVLISALRTLRCAGEPVMDQIASMGAIVGITSSDIELPWAEKLVRSRETLIGNLVADALHDFLVSRCSRVVPTPGTHSSPWPITILRALVNPWYLPRRSSAASPI